MLGSANETPYDLRFRLLGIPVRVHPLFWLFMLIIGGGGGKTDLLPVVVFVGCAFISILVHEFGHGLAARAVGDEPSGIVLYAMGGYCMAHVSRPLPRLFMLLAGPGAGFLLLTLVLGLLALAYRIQPAEAMSLIGVGPGDFVAAVIRLPNVLVVRYAIHYLLYINFWWGILNLMPAWPLDGGQATQVLLGYANRSQATRWTHVIGLLTAGLLALWRGSQEDWGTAILFGYIAVVNFQILQSMHDSFRSEWGPR